MTARDIKRAHRKQEERTANPHMRQWRRLLKGIGKHGGRFVEIAPGSRQPTRKAWNQTENTLTTAQALTLLADGYNIGHAGGTGDLYVIDFDRDAERGHECAQLTGGLYTHRPNAPDRAKFIIRCPDPLPTRHAQHDIDLIGFNANGTHAQATIAGIHNSGAPILWGGHTIPTLDAETVAALWEEWTGQPLFAPERGDRSTDITYTDADLARVADALKHVDPNALDYNTWIGIIAAVHDAFGDDALDLMVDWADGKPGEVEGKWGTFDRDYTGRGATVEGIFYRARQNGWQDTWLQDHLHAYRFWLASPDAIVELKEIGFRNPERARKLLDAILQKCEGKKAPRVTPGYAWLAKESGISKGGIGGYLARLFTGGLVNLHVSGDGDPTVIELVFHNLNTYYPSGEGVQVVKNWKIYREFRADEVFLNNHAAYAKTHPRPALQPLGDNGLGALLALLDGPTTITDAAALVGYSYGAMARTMRRFEARGVVAVTHGERNRKTYTLNEEWRTIIDRDRPHMPTYGVMLFRNVEMLKNRVKQLRKKGLDERADLVEKEYRRLDDIASHVRQSAGITASERPMPRQERKLKRLKHLYHFGEKIEHRHKPRGYKPKRPGVSIFAADAEWDALNAWAVMTYGAGWWVRRDVNGVLGAYEQYLIAQDHVPTMHWDGPQAVAA